MNITAATEMGLRPYQEDRFVLNQNDDGIFAVILDGHGGDEVSDAVHLNIADLWKKTSGNINYRLESLISTLGNQYKKSRAGSTLSIVYIPKLNNIVHVAILGDSPVIIKSKDKIVVSPEHNVRTNMVDRDNLIEEGAIVMGGYYYTSYGANAAGLQLTRALGDAEFNGFIKIEPEIYSVELDQNSWVLLGSDGLVDPGHIRNNQISTTKTPVEQIVDLIDNNADANDLVKYAVNIPTYDNATAILIKL